jgi:hypothetical protein
MGRVLVSYLNLRIAFLSHGGYSEFVQMNWVRDIWRWTVKRSMRPGLMRLAFVNIELLSFIRLCTSSLFTVFTNSLFHLI